MESPPPRVQKFLKNNKTWSETTKPSFPTMKQLRTAAWSGEQKALLICQFSSVKIYWRIWLIVSLTCLDPRCVPEQYFGPNIGAGVIRNAGGRVSDDVVKSILVIRSLADVSVIVVVHHSDCGMMHLTQQQIVEEAKKRTPGAAAKIQALGDYGCFTEDELEKSVKEDVLKLKKEESLEGIQVLGFTLDLHSGLAEQLDI